MSLIRLNHITYRIDGKVDDLLHDVSFEINARERVGLIGPNGCGKTTLLRMIRGEVRPDAGEIYRSDAIAGAGYLRQHTPPSSEQTVLEAALAGLPDVAALYARRRQLEATMEAPDKQADTAMVNEYGNTLDAYHSVGGYEFEQAAGDILMGLGFEGDELEKPMALLSSGQRTRVELARLLAQPTAFLMLDEPTNHLDIEGQNWLERYLERYSGAVLIVSHDRHFLDQTTERILELRRGRLRSYAGNYSDYAAARTQEEESAWTKYERAGKEAQRLRSAVGERKRMARKVQGNKATSGGSADFYAHKASKVMKRAKAIEKKVTQQLEQQKTHKPFVEKRTILDFPPMEESGTVVLNAVGLSKRFGDVALFSDITFSVNRGQRTAIIGRNGSGKTTLVKILLGELAADAGDIHQGSRVRIGYYDQEQEGLNPEKTILEEAMSAGPVDETWARMVLGALLLRKDKVHDRIKVLSIGERGRVALAKLLLSGVNTLVLDEPTNHMDIDARIALEQALENYPGTIIFISHDRRLIEYLADTILIIEAGRIRYYSGEYVEDMWKAYEN